MPSTLKIRARELPLCLGLILIAAALCACGASARSGASSAQRSKPDVTGKPMRIAFRDYRSGQDLELVNQSHSAPEKLYSSVRSSAVRKVQTDEVIEALYDHLKQQGFESHAKRGEFPTASDGVIVAGMEIEDKNGTRHWMAYKGQDAKEKAHLLECAKAFVDTYNLTYALQTVDLAPGQDPFRNPVGSTVVKDKQPIVEVKKSKTGGG